MSKRKTFVSKQKKIEVLLDKGLSAKVIASKLKVNPNYVYTVRWLAKKKPTKKGATKVSGKTRLLREVSESMAEIRSVKHPSHYTVGGIETWDFIQAKRLNYNLGSVVKYISRADYKGKDIEDLKKAREFLDREIKWREDGNLIR